MSSARFCLVVLLATTTVAAARAEDVAAGPKLFLNAQRLRRLKRDRERKTLRWANFESRVMNAPDSPERGFELALYYAITGDEGKGRDAVEWAVRHTGDARVAAIVLDWCAPLISSEQKKKLAGADATLERGIAGVRDKWFLQLEAGGETLGAPNLNAEMAGFVTGGYRNAEELYALCELIYAVRANTRTDLRSNDAPFFSHLPEMLLLSAKPGALARPGWKMHIAALALVAIDPNLPASQFLQSWALEDNQTLREGPGVAYELLWADPYLPGVGYQNMDTFVYDEHGEVFARANWEPDSCWVHISAQGMEQQNCPAHWQDEEVTFGHLTLVPMPERCLDLRKAAPNETLVVWKLTPGAKLSQGKGQERRTTEADAAGLWRPGGNTEGKVCVVTH